MEVHDPNANRHAQLVDGIFIGHVMGAEGLAAINMAWPWVGLIAGVGLMVGAGTGTLCSIAQGQGDIKRAGQIIVHGLLLLLGVGLIVSVLIIFGTDGLLSVQGAHAMVKKHGADYLIVMGWCAPVVLASIAMPILVRNLGAPRLATVMMITGALINTVLDYIFIVEWNLGLHGAAVATVIGEFFSAAIGIIFVFSRHSIVPLAPISDTLRNIDWKACRDILVNGFSSLLMYLYASFAVILHNAALMHYGTSVNVAAYAISGYLMTIYYLAAEGFAAGMQPIVSYFYGAKQFEPVQKAFRIALICIVGGGILFVLLTMFFPVPATWIFIGGEDAELQSVAITTLRLHLFVLFLDGYLVLASAYFQSIGMGTRAIWITFLNMCIQIPFLLVLAPWLGTVGVLLALPTSTIVLSIWVYFLLKKHFAESRHVL